MAYVGNTATTQGFIPTVDYFSGNGSSTAFTLSRPVASVYQIQVVIDNVPQNPTSAYTVSGSTITFTSAPLSGTNNIYVSYTSPITQLVAPAPGTVGLSQLNATGTASSSTFLRGDNSWQVVAVTPTAVSDQANSSTGYFALPSGTTAQRPASAANGYTRYNTTTAQIEVYNATYSNWSNAGTSGAQYSASYLVVAGGGGGGKINGAGGGGGGGLLSGTATLVLGTLYTVTVGSGGTGSSTTYGANGSNSSFVGGSISVASIGGGGGGGSDTSTTPENSGRDGGSGGGGGTNSSTTVAGGAGTSGQGYAGGSGLSDNASWRSGGGGGGASAVGSNGANPNGGNGGAGAASSITGSSVTYAGGGGGGSYTTPGGTGGSGGGGNGGTSGASGTNGTTNLGGGGGGAGRVNPGSNGGSGVVIISVPTASYSGTTTGSPTITTSGSNTIIKFTSSGTYTA